MPKSNVVTQFILWDMFDYDRHNGKLIHRHTVQGGKRKGESAGAPHNAGYLQILIQGRKYLIHRLVWLYHYGYMPSQIDHINRDRSDNRLENLRECSYSQNHGNRGLGKNNTSGAKGVYLDKRDGYWFVRMANEYKGRFKTKDDAIKAYDIAAREYFENFALTNKDLGVM